MGSSRIRTTVLLAGLVLAACSGQEGRSGPEGQGASDGGEVAAGTGSGSGASSENAGGSGSYGSGATKQSADTGAGADNSTIGRGGITDGSGAGSAGSSGSVSAHQNSGDRSAGGHDAGGQSSGASDGGGAGDLWCPTMLLEGSCDSFEDQPLAPGQACPDVAECYESEMCGEEILCVAYEEDDSCTEEPSCDADQMELVLCSRGPCEVRSVCGEVIWCQTLPGADENCQPSAQPHREYAAFADECTDLQIVCPEGSEPFSNDCGCGCEQPEECPESVNCMPRVDSTDTQLCGADACPFTQRTY